MSNNVMDELHKLKKGSVLFVQGEPSTYLYIVKSGEIMIFREEGSKLFPVSVIGPQQFIGEISIFTDEVRTATAVVSSDAEVYLVKKSDIKKIVRSCPEWLSEIMETLCDRLKHATDILREHKIQNEDMISGISPQQEKEFLDAISSHRSGRGL